jgi:NAD+ diphosphatase
MELELTNSSSSQPWPYPANLMVGCYGRAKPDQTIRLDLDNELEGTSPLPSINPRLILQMPNSSHDPSLPS